MALDYASILGASQQLVSRSSPDWLQDQQQQLQQQEIEARTQAIQANALKAQQAHQRQQRQQQYQTDLDHVLLSGGDPQSIQRMMLRYPEMADNLKPVLESMDKDHLVRNQTQLGTIFARGQNGDFKGAATALQQRVDADKAAGQPDPADQAVLDGLNSNDPVQQKAAIATIGIHLAAMTGDKFAETYKNLNPDEKLSPFMREYQDRVTQFGKSAADQWAALQDDSAVVAPPGGRVYRKSDILGIGPTTGGAPAQQPEGGDQSAPAGYSMPVAHGSFGAADQQFGAKRDGGARSHNGLDIAAPAGSPVNPIAPGKVVAVGDQPGMGGLFVKVKHADGTISSYAHLGSQAVKVGQDVGPGDELGTVGTTGNASGPVVHLVIRKNGRAVDPRPLLTGAAVVRTKQQYDALPPGTQYIAPDGSHRMKG